MAQQEKTKAKTTKAAPKKVDPTLTPEQQLAVKRAELLEAKKGLGSTLQNPHAIKVIKKDIARLLTKINHKKEEK